MSSSLVIYHWLTDSQFLLFHLAPDAVILEASVPDTVEEVGARLPPNASRFAFHLNCTQTGRFPLCRADLIIALEQRGLQVLNGGVTDISKRHIQERCRRLGLLTTRASPDGDPDETIIVKTNLNFGGNSEWALSEQDRSLLGIDPGSDIIWKPEHYRLLPRREVDPAWWSDPRLICERYVRNATNHCYRAYLLRDYLALCRLVNPEEIKKMDRSRLDHLWMITLPHLPPDGPPRLLHDLVLFIREFGLDFGTVDLVEDDQGRPYIIDVNTTPGYNYPVPGVADHLRQFFALTE
jgi:hypothetical protein